MSSSHHTFKISYVHYETPFGNFWGTIWPYLYPKDENFLLAMITIRISDILDLTFALFSSS